MDFKILLNILFSFISCCTNVISFEKILNVDKNITTFLTFVQNIFITITLGTFKGTIRNKIKKKSNTSFMQFLIPIILQNVSAYIGNLVFRYNLSMPTHIIFRSGGTVVTMIMGYLFFNKKYSRDESIGAILIAFGTMTFTLDNASSTSTDSNSSYNVTTHWIYGFNLLLLATIINSFTSLYKEKLYQGTDGLQRVSWVDTMFYNYLYGLLIFVPLWSKICNELKIVESITIENDKFLPMVIFNCLSQLLCVVGVNILVVKVSALSLSVILLCRRIVSLGLSVILFENEFNFCGIISCILVFTGVSVYLKGVKGNKEPKIKGKTS